ncbi:MAG: hypothetical protein HYY45_03715, partial [Deltaproteobacteria bacterium]|nr:hypothetical protein [Deltaproteobacteria bacterium]
MVRSGPPLLNSIVPLRLRGRLTITGRITLWYLILSITPILAIGFLAYQDSRATLEKEITSRLKALADGKSYTLQGWVKSQLEDARNLAAHTAVRDLLSPSFRIIYPTLAAKSD